MSAVMHAIGKARIARAQRLSATIAGLLNVLGFVTIMN